MGPRGFLLSKMSPQTKTEVMEQIQQGSQVGQDNTSRMESICKLLIILKTENVVKYKNKSDQTNIKHSVKRSVITVYVELFHEKKM